MGSCSMAPAKRCGDARTEIWAEASPAEHQGRHGRQGGAAPEVCRIPGRRGGRYPQPGGRFRRDLGRAPRYPGPVAHRARQRRDRMDRERERDPGPDPRMKVPYEPTPIRAVGTHDPVLIYRPMIHVRLIGPKGNVRLFGRIDTGADDSLFPEAIADLLGVEFRRGQYEPLRLPGGGVTAARYSEVDLEIRSPEGPYRWAALVGFHQGNSTLLGLAGF